MLNKWHDWMLATVQARASAHEPPAAPDALDWALGSPAFGLRPDDRAPDFVGLRPPASFEAYRVLVHQAFDPAKHALANAAAREGALFEAFRRWRPGELEANRALFHPVYDRLSALMGDIYRFEPARLGHGSDLRGNLGLYDQRGLVAIAEQLLKEPIGEVFDTIVHEQMHRFQHTLTLGLSAPGGRALTGQEARLAAYWLLEEPLAQSFYGRAITPELLPAYRRLGKEYHAFDTAEYVTHAVLGSYRRPGR